MRSQFAILLALTAGAACTGNSASPAISPISLPVDAPDLSLRGVAFARLSEGRVVSRGTADHVDYRRAGGRLAATKALAAMNPEPGTHLASYQGLRFTAPQVDGEVAARRGTATGGVTLVTGRGDDVRTDAVTYDGAVVRSETRVVARGPGYQLEGNGLVAQADGSSVQIVRGVTGQMQVGARP